MKAIELRNKLIQSLEPLYDIEAIISLTEIWQGELGLLVYLSQNKSSQNNPSILSDRLRVSRSRITAALSVLRKKGYVTMEMSEEDRRRVCVMITKSGEARVKWEQEKIEGYFDLLVEGLGEENVVELIRLIELSIKVLKNKIV